MEKGYVCGVDNSRRQEAIGKIIIAGIVIPKKDLNWLYEKIGVRDSKRIKHKIDRLAKFLNERYKTTVFKISAKEISSSPNLNQLEAKYVLRIVQKYYDQVEIFYLDAIGANPDLIYSYEGKFNDYSKKIIIEPRADEKYIATMCASIIAKYYSNTETEYLKTKYNAGSGAPSDIRTLLYLLKNLDNKHEIIRTNWITYKRLKENKRLCNNLKLLIESGKFTSTKLKEIYKNG